MNERNRRILILLEKLQEKTIYLYGAGKRGEVALENLKAFGLEQRVAAFIDDSYLGGGILRETGIFYTRSNEFCE